MAVTRTADARVRTARRASTVTLWLAGLGVASLAAKLVLEEIRRSDECGTAITLALDWCIWVAIGASALAVVSGVVAIAARSDRTVRTAVAIGFALVVGTLVLVPDGLGSYVCGVGTP